MKIAEGTKSTVLAMCLMFAAANAYAVECTVNDPSGTPLNVRSRPNGSILGGLHNGATVFVSKLVMDGRGRRWAKIVPVEEGKSGWVFREYLSCEDRTRQQAQIGRQQPSRSAVYRRWDEIFQPQYTKPLPRGYFDFIDLPPDVQRQRFSGDGAAFCQQWANAISYGKRIALGYSPKDAVDDIIDARDGERVCGFIEGVIVSPLRIAIRGDDANHKITIIEWVDQRGKIHYTGSPKNW